MCVCVCVCVCVSRESACAGARALYDLTIVIRTTCPDTHPDAISHTRRTQVPMLVLPRTNVDESALASTLEAPVINAKDTVWLANALARVSGALASIKIEHRADVVVPFPDLVGL